MMALLLNANDSVSRSYSITKPSPLHPQNVSGVGEKTGNLFDRLGTYSAGAFNNVYLISGLDTSLSYTCSTSLARVAGATAASIYLSQSTSASAATNGVWLGEEKTFTPNENGELYVLVRNTAAGGAPAVADDVIAGNITIMLNSGSTAQPYEPYGWCVPVNVQSGNLICASQTGSATSSGLTLTYTQGSSAVTLDKDTTSGAVFGTIPTSITLAAGTYTASVQNLLVKVANVYDRIYLVDSSNNVIANYIMSDAPKSFTLAAETTISKISFVCDASSVYDNVTITVMLNRGSTPLPYQPYSNTTTNIYLGSATSTRRIKKLVLTGSESERWSYVPSGGISRFRIELADTAAVTELKSTHYVYELANAYGNAFVNTTLTALTICHSSANIYAFKDFLAEQYANGTPVTVWYVLAEPETAVVNEPLMKIGSYADEISKTSTGVDIPTVNGSNTLSVNTTVQPSEMSIESISQWV